MTPDDFYTTVLTPGLAYIRKIIPHIPASTNEQVMLMAIAGQESGWSALEQRPVDYANSYWQFERTGGVQSLMRDDETSRFVAMMCGLAGIPFQSTAIWRYMATEAADSFSCAMARLLLWTDPMPLPKNEQGAWLCYSRLWRPGAPDRQRWSIRYPQAVAAVTKGQSV